MVLGEVADGVAVLADGVGELWGYNRDNFLYDRTMRQETDLKIAEWKAAQAGQWREDVQDLTGLTEKKMDVFLVVNTLQLGMCVALYTEGRLQPGTPHWLLHLYVVSLTAAFMYLLMSVWLSMHASIAAACERARLRTQFVRLPIPTWDMFDNMRTTAASFERLGGRSLRVPFLDTIFERQANSSGSEVTPNQGSAQADGSSPWAEHLPMNAKGASRIEADAGATAPREYAGHTDTWGLEDRGEDIAELSERPLHTNKHILDVRNAQTHYQCYDAFSRVSMAFGTNQLLYSIAYYCIGYVSVGDGAPWPAAILAIVMMITAVGLVDLDISFSRHDKFYGIIFMTAGPACALVSTIAWCQRPRLEILVGLLIPPAYICHGLWLLWALKACQVSMQPGGEMLPKKFRTVMYLDVFGWIHKTNRRNRANSLSTDGEGLRGDYMAMSQNGQNTYSPVASPMSAARASSIVEQLKPTLEVLPEYQAHRRYQLATGVRSALKSWQSQSRLHRIDEFTEARLEKLANRLNAVGEASSPIQEHVAASMPKGFQWDRAESELCTEDTMVVPRHINVLSECELHRRDSFDALEQEQLQAGQASGRWQKMKYCTEFGTEVSYLYDPQTGEVRHTNDQHLEDTPFPVFEGTGHLDQSPRSPGGCVVDEELHSLSEAEEEMAELEDICLQESRPLSRRPSRLSSEDTIVGDRESTEQALPKREASSGSRERFSQRPSSQQQLPKSGFDISRLTSVSESVEKVEKVRRIVAHRAAQAAPWLWADEDEQIGQDQSEPSSPEMQRASANAQSGPPTCRTRAVKEVQQCLKPGADANNSERIMADDHDKMPWKVFRYATLFLVMEWMLSPFMLYGMIGGVTEFGPKQLDELVGRTRSFAEQEDPDGTWAGMVNNKYAYDNVETLVEPTKEVYGNLPFLDDGQRVLVQWPRQSTFSPRSFSSDVSGTHIVVSDDFSLYTGRIQSDNRSVRVEEPGQVTQVHDKSRLLRGTQDSHPSFASVPHCSALEGQVLKDVGVVCPAKNAATANCRALVLHADGRLLTECPLVVAVSNQITQEETTSKPGVERMLELAMGPAARPAGIWKISGQWLDPDNETVESVAVNDECGVHDNENEESSDGRAFDPDEVGCVLVGTSSGRVVQLRRHVSKDDQLVPEWAIQERLGNVAPGSIHVYPGGYVVMLRKEINLMQAFDSHQGSLLGQWRLPVQIEWQSLTGGGDWLFMLGRDRKDDKKVDDEIKMWRFPLPIQLKRLFAAHVARK